MDGGSHGGKRSDELLDSIAMDGMRGSVVSGRHRNNMDRAAWRMECNGNDHYTLH